MTTKSKLYVVESLPFSSTDFEPKALTERVIINLGDKMHLPLRLLERFCLLLEAKSTAEWMSDENVYAAG